MKIKNHTKYDIEEIVIWDNKIVLKTKKESYITFMIHEITRELLTLRRKDIIEIMNTIFTYWIRGGNYPLSIDELLEFLEKTDCYEYLPHDKRLRERIVRAIIDPEYHKQLLKKGKIRKKLMDAHARKRELEAIITDEIRREAKEKGVFKKEIGDVKLYFLYEDGYYLPTHIIIEQDNEIKITTQATEIINALTTLRYHEENGRSKKALRLFKSKLGKIEDETIRNKDLEYIMKVIRKAQERKNPDQEAIEKFLTIAIIKAS